MDKSTIQIINQLNKNIAVIGSQGSWFELDEMGKDILSQKDGATTSGIVASLSSKYKTDDILGFIGAVEKALSQTTTGKLHKTEKRNIVNKMYLQVTTECNLRCRYCYAEETAHLSSCESMSLETALKAIDLFLEENKNEEICYLDFDGGEPLLNRPLIQKVAEYIDEKTKNGGPQILMTIASNGSTLNAENVKFLNDNNIRFGISFDGMPEIQNKARPLAGGHGSYDRIISTVNSLLKKRSVIAQATVTPRSLDILGTVNHLSELGFRPVQVEPAYACADEAWQIKEGDIPQIKDGFTRMAEIFLSELEKENILPYYNFTEILSRLERRQKRLYGCSVGVKMCAVAPDGIIYPCYRFWGNREYQMGSVDQGFDRKSQHFFENTHVDNRNGCQRCWARYFCGGKCLYLSLYFNKDYNQPYELNCQVIKHLLSLSLALYQHLKDKPHLLKSITQYGGK